MATVLINQESRNHDTQLFDQTAATVTAASAASSPFRRIEFHLAKKPFTGFANGGGGGSGGGFRLETLNPSTSSNFQQRQLGSNQVNGPLPIAEKKRDGSGNGLDPEAMFRITIRRIGAGLENLGNTCFLNSVLQCLTYTEPLAAYLQSGKHQLSCRCSGFCALCAMQKHVSRALQLTGKILAPKDLVSNLRCISRNFRNSRQEDAHEYMVNLLESMHKCCLPSGVPSESPSAYEKSLVHKIFGGRLRSQVKCLQCSFCSDKFDPFLDLSLEIVKADNVNKALTHFTAKEHLDGGERQYQCQHCKQKVRALKQLTIDKAPYILTIHLKRFSHLSGQKIDKKVHFPPTLDLKPFVSGPYDEELKYTLYGVLVHAGWSTHSGHYYCFVRASSGLWYVLDDNKVVQVSEKKVFEQKAYMLFYSRDIKRHVVKKPVDVVPKEMIINGIARNITTSNLKVRDEVKTIGSARSSNGFNSTASAAHSNASTITVASQENIVKAATEKAIGSLASCSGPTKPPLLDSPSKVPTHDGLVNGKSALIQCSTISKQTNNLKSNDAKNVQPAAEIINSSTDSTITKDSKTSIDIPSSGKLPETSVTMMDKNEQVISPPLVENENSSTEKSGFDSAPVGVSDSQKSVNAEISTVPRTKCRSPKEKARGLKPSRKLKRKHLKCQVTSMHLSLKNILIGASLSVSKKKKHKRTKKGTKKLSQEHLVELGPSSDKVKSVAVDGLNNLPEKDLKLGSKKGDKAKNGKNSTKISSEGMHANAVDKEISERSNKHGAELATVAELEKSSGSALQGSVSIDSKKETISNNNRIGQNQTASVNMLTRGLEETPILRWDEVSSNSVPLESRRKKVSIGYIGDEWDEEYDRGKRKKVRNALNKFDGENPFQEIATKKAKLNPAKLDQSSSGNRPFRIL